MPRGSFKHEDAQQAGGGFQEGYLRLTKSVIAIHKFGPNSKTGVQSDAFTAMRWTGKRLDSEWNELEGEEAETSVTIPIRLGMTDQMRPGKLDAKDFDNIDVEPDDLGDEVDTEGNALFMVEDAKVGRGWAIMEESLRKAGFKPEISGRGVASDFVGLVAHFKTVEGAKYIAKKGKDAGKEVTPSNLVCDRIHTFPYDKKATGAKTTASKSTASTAAAGGKTNGKATESASVGAGDDVTTATKAVFGNLSDNFRKQVPIDKDVDRAGFQKALAMELMRQKVAPKSQKAILDLVKDDEKLGELAMELVGETGSFVVGDGVVTFSA